MQTSAAQTPAIKPSKLPLKLACGAIAGVTGTLIIYPLDIIKTTLQNSHSNQSISSAIKSITRNGMAGLYRGLGPNLVGIVPEKAIKLAVNDYAREWLGNGDGEGLGSGLGMVAGATAGFCQVVATNPMEIVKIRMQLGGSLSTIFKDLGLRGMYKGTAATLCRDVPFRYTKH